MTMKELNHSKKKLGDELQQYLQFRRRGFSVRAKKGKGSYTRRSKHSNAPIAQ